MKRTIRLKESDLVKLIKRVIKEEIEDKPLHFTTIQNTLSPLGFKFEDSGDTLSLDFGDKNNNFLSVIYYKEDPRYYVISLGGGKYNTEVEPPRRMNPKKIFERNYTTSEVNKLIDDVKTQLPKLKQMMGLTNKA
jgi:hypothetical protein